MTIRIYSPLPDRIPGGRAHKQPPINVDPWQLWRGVQVEMEHTRDPRIAYEIAIDHLYEIPDYYTRLDRMEREAGLGGLSTGYRTALVSGLLVIVGALVGLGIELYTRRG